MALVEDRLYKTGPGPHSIIRDGVRVHPVSGLPALDCAMVSLPPQFGKSTMLSGLLPAWHLTNWPDWPVIFVTHTGDYAEKYGSENRDHIETHPELGIRVSQDSRAKDYFEIEGHRGYMLSVGVGSNRVTGRKGKLIVMDDMIGSEEDAQSPRFRAKMLDYWYARLRTRRMRGTKYLYVGTRWVFNDFPGHIQQTEPERWFVVNLPALAFDTTDSSGISVDPDTKIRDPLGRKPGQSLCPELHSEKELEVLRKANPGWFVPLYQGRPAMAEGALFRDFFYYTLSEHGYKIEDNPLLKETDCVRFAVVDTALTTKTSSDYSVFGVFDLTPQGNLLVRQIIRDRIPGDQTDEWIKKQAKEWQCSQVWVEEAPNSYALIQRLERSGDLIVRRAQTKGKDKYTRATPAADGVNTGHIRFPSYGAWKEECEEELRQFDKGEHDDQVDVIAYAWTHSRDMPRKRPGEQVLVRTTLEQKFAKAVTQQSKKRVTEIHLHPDVGLW